MRRIALTTTAVVAAALMALSGCSTRTDDGGAAGGDGAAGFEEGAVIGVALPARTSENWVLAGDLFENGLTEAGFDPDVQYAGSSTTVQDQQNQISSMITNGAAVIIVGSEDGGQLTDQVQQAEDAGITVIAYDRPILNTEAVDYYLAYDNFRVGELQATALLEGMEERYGEGPYNIELFSGATTDANAAVFFDGAMSILEPEIESGNVVVLSGQTEIAQTATADWAAEEAQARMDQLITSTYGSAELDGVLSPNDTLARAIITSIQSQGKEVPIVTGQDSEVESVRSIMDGIQYSTINKDTRNLVARAIEMVQSLQAGEEIATDEVTDNGAYDVPSIFLDPVIVTRENAAESYANDPNLAPLTEG